MTKTDHETFVIDELNTTDAGDGWRRIDKIETTGSVEIRVNNLLVGSISAGGSISAVGPIRSSAWISAGGSIGSDAWISSGGSISAVGPIRSGRLISSGGSVSADAWISSGGSIGSGGSISAGRLISSGGSISADGSISAGESISADGSISAGRLISSGGSISADGSISAGESILCRVLYWGMLTLPECTEIVATHAVRPPEWQREHWADRLGVQMPKSDCYDEIERQYASRLPEWLARTDLLPVERLILESHTPEARTKADARAKELRGAGS